MKPEELITIIENNNIKEILLETELSNKNIHIIKIKEVKYRIENDILYIF